MNTEKASRKEELNAQFEELFKNAAFMEALKDCGSESEVLGLFAEYGVHMTDEEISEAKAEAKIAFDNLKNSGNEELSEEMLENVAGGKSKWGKILKTVAGGALIVGGCMTANPYFAAAGGMLIVDW